MKVKKAEHAQTLLKAGKIDEAKAYCASWIELAENAKDNSDAALANHSLGLVLAKKGDWKSALSAFSKAISFDSNIAEYHTNISNVHLSLGNLDEALQHLNQSLRIHPHHTVSYNNLGRILYLQGRINEAIPYFEKALRINPDYWEAHYNLAHSMVKLNQVTRAAEHYQMVIKLFPEHPNAHFNLGLLSMEEKNYEDAVHYFTKSLKLDPKNLEAYRQMGDAQLNLGKKDEAKATFLKALEINPNSSEIQHNLAILHLRDKERDEALNHFKKAVDLNPQDHTAQHMTQALSGNQESLTAPKTYIKDLFDQYADYYNKHVKESLKYEVPGLLRNAIGRVISPGYRIGRVLDLGCGTGLCGIYFRDLAFELIGIDISPKMIERAEQLKGYDSLIVRDMIEYLSDEKLEPFLLIFSADVLVYTGDLEKVFTLIAKKLKPNGLFAFTTEWIEDAETKSYFLKPTGRFAHASGYIRDLAERHQLKIELAEKIIPREHEGTPIQGELFILRSLKD